MCWCTPEIRTPVCGKIDCVPPSTKPDFAALNSRISGGAEKPSVAVNIIRLDEANAMFVDFIQSRGYAPAYFICPWKVFLELKTELDQQLAENSGNEHYQLFGCPIIVAQTASAHWAAPPYKAAIHFANQELKDNMATKAATNPGGDK